MLSVIKKSARIVGGGKVNISALAKEVGCHRAALYDWKKIPLEYVPKFVRATKGRITVAMLRPDIVELVD